MTADDSTSETAAIALLSQTIVRLEELLRKYILFIQSVAGSDYLTDSQVQNDELSEADLAELRHIAASDRPAPPDRPGVR